jgi:hypothetical protein
MFITLLKDVQNTEGITFSKITSTNFFICIEIKIKFLV